MSRRSGSFQQQPPPSHSSGGTRPVIEPSPQAVDPVVDKRNAVRKTYFGYETKHPLPTDIQRRKDKDQEAGRAYHDLPLHPKFNNYRGHTKCKYCNIFIPTADMMNHYEDCPLVPMRCELKDSETGEPCHLTTRGRQLMVEHQQVCPMRTELCTNAGCGQEVSVQSMAFHLQRCNYETKDCETCHRQFLRSDLNTHCQLCPEAIIPCPLLCGEHLRRCDLTGHIMATASQHKEALEASHHGQPIPSESSIAIYLALISKINDLHEHLEQMYHHPGSRGVSPQRTGQTQQTSNNNNHNEEETVGREENSEGALGGTKTFHADPNISDMSLNSPSEVSMTSTAATNDNAAANKKVVVVLKNMSYAERTVTVKNEIKLVLEDIQEASNGLWSKNKAAVNPAPTEAQLTSSRHQLAAKVENVKLYSKEYAQLSAQLLKQTSAEEIEDPAAATNGVMVSRDSIEEDQEEVQMSTKKVERAWYELKCSMYEKLWLPDQQKL